MNSIAGKPLPVRALAIALCVAIAFVCLPADASAAASKNAKAHAAFEKYVWTKLVSNQFDSAYPYEHVPVAFFDIDKDGIDEMLTYMESPAYPAYTIYSYRKGKVKVAGGEAQVTELNIYPKTHVVSMSSKGSDNWYGESTYKVSAGKSVYLAARNWRFNDNGAIVERTYYIKNKKVSKAKYSKYAKSLKKGKKTTRSSLVWHYFAPSLSTGHRINDWPSQKTKTYYVKFKAPTGINSLVFELNLLTDVKDGLPYAPTTSKAKIRLYDSNNKAIGKAYTVTGQKGLDYRKYKLKGNKYYYFKITTYNKKTAGNYGCSFDMFWQEPQM